MLSCAITLLLSGAFLSIWRPRSCRRLCTSKVLVTYIGTASHLPPLLCTWDEGAEARIQPREATRQTKNISQQNAYIGGSKAKLPSLGALCMAWPSACTFLVHFASDVSMLSFFGRPRFADLFLATFVHVLGFLNERQKHRYSTAVVAHTGDCP